MIGLMLFIDVSRVCCAGRATYNDKLRDAVVAELSTINRNLQMMKEELIELSLRKPASIVSQSDW